MVHAVAAQVPSWVVISPEAHRMERLAAREMRRYLYLRTGTLPEVLVVESAVMPETVVVTVKGRPVITDPLLQTLVAGLGREEFLLKTVAHDGGMGRTWWIIGGDAQGALYGAYRFVEKLGVRFYLHGDVVPEQPLSLVPDLDETGRPVFATRGVLPFHLFPEGPDWWNRDDYLAYLAQVAKQRMNFWGMHTYTFPGVEEPLVWIGLPGDFDRTGRVQFSPPSSWANTQRPQWLAGYAPVLTTEFANGAASLFPSNVHAAEVMTGLTPKPATLEDSNLLYNRVGELLRDVFSTARGLGIQSCVGTELPMILGPELNAHLQQLGKSAAAPAVRRELFRGILGRMHTVHPVDYYWFWTPEQWTWQGNSLAQYEQVTNDLHLALSALADLGNPTRLATCGWVLGPQHNRSALDAFLPGSVPISALNRNLGFAPIEIAFQQIENRPKWAIPWVENDAQMSVPQLWAGRMLYDAADAHWLGCDGLIGLHWRNKVTALSQAALAAASWDLSYVPASFHEARPAQPDGAIGGDVAAFTAPVANTTEDAIYQTVRYDVSAYRLVVSNGTYTVTLKFNEPYYTQPGKRVFGARVQGLPAFEHLDIIAAVGGNYALDFSYPGIAVTNGELRIDFIAEVEFPCIAGIVIEGLTSSGSPFSRKINCGGPAVLGYEADPVGISGRDATRTIFPLEHYRDFARANFGPEVAEAAASILAGKDGKLFLPATWDNGAGAIVIQQTPWLQILPQFTFVDELAALRPQVQGAGNLERFDYWLNTFRYLAALTEVACTRGQLDQSIQQINATTNAPLRLAYAQTALSNRIALARAWDRMMEHLLATVSTTGELGTVANLHQQNLVRRQFLTTNDAVLAAALGAPLPPSVNLSTNYAGPDRLVVPTVRTLAASNETLVLRALLMTTNPVSQPPVLHWRWLGQGDFQSVPMTNFGGTNFQAALPAATNDLEYRLTATLAGTNPLTWPAGGLPQTVVIWSPPVRPAAPTGLTVTSTTAGITLCWDAVPGATGYQVRRATSHALSFPLLAVTTATTFTDTAATATNAAPFWYVVCATNADYESIDSEVVAAIPPVPLVAVAGDGGGSVVLKWPGWATGLRPYRATNLVPPVNWEAVAAPPVLSNGMFRLLLPVTNAPQQFFRLGHP
jgi:hypothetical protein